MVRDFLIDLRDATIHFVSHRLFILFVFFLGLFGIIIHRLFVLQIVEGQEHLDNFTLKSQKTVTIPSSRGNIYDRNGNLLAYNKLAYSLTLTFEDTDKISELAKSQNITENDVKNSISLQLVNILEKNGDTYLNDFPIVLNSKGQLEFNISDTTLLRFKKEVYSVKSVDDLTEEQINATATDVFNYLAYGNNKTTNFNISKDYSVEDSLKIMAIRYPIWLNRYTQYESVTIAKDICDSSIAEILENCNIYPGTDIVTDSIRVYNDSEYFSHIIGYTGSISEDELSEYNANIDGDNLYTVNNSVGKTGIEQIMESDLRGIDGTQVMFVDNLGKILEVTDTKEAQSGSDVYLTLDSDLQKKCYAIVEQHIADILVSCFSNTTNTYNSDTSKNYFIPISDVYFALFDNNIISIDSLYAEDASTLESSVYASFISRQDNVITQLNTILTSSFTETQNLGDDYQDYTAYIYTYLNNKGILSITDKKDENYLKWQNDSISLGDLLKYSISQGWVDISSLDISNDYYDTDEVYNAIVNYVLEQIKQDVYFDKLIIKYMIKSGTLSGNTVCQLLYDQGVLSVDDADYVSLINGSVSAFDFIRNKVKNLEITPAQLALDPCSGSIVITDVNNGEVLALVSYPSYDNNKLANGVDAAYYNQLLNDKSIPLYNRATQQKTAPGSTFKIVSSVAGYEEGVVGVNDRIYDEVVFDKTETPAKCWSSVSHGDINMSQAIEVSCNYYFYEVGYSLASLNGTYSDSTGVDKLATYAGWFGLDKNSGIEIPEADPNVSTRDAIRSAIGQGTNSYTPTQLSRYVTTIANGGTCYNLSLVKSVQDSNGKETYTDPHEVINQVDLPNELWNSIYTGMRAVVSEESGTYTDLGVNVAGKTGTAQEDKARSNHALFVSYAPYEDPTVSVTVVIPFGDASANAVAVAKDVYSYYFEQTGESSTETQQ